MTQILHIGLDKVDANAGAIISRLKGRLNTSDADHSTMGDFLQRLSGYTWREFVPDMPDRDLTPLPAPYRNVRIFDGRDGRLLASLWSLGAAGDHTEVGEGFQVRTKPLTASCIVVSLLGMLHEEITRWASTRMLTSSGSGVLDLQVNIDTRPRQNIIGDMVLPDRLLALTRRSARRFPR